MKKSKLKNKNGITLIALIITIIIMLILVAVSINIIIKSDLFGAAQNAADKTKTAYEKEGKLSEITIGDKTYSSIEEYLKSNETAGHDWKRTGDDLTCKCSQCTEEGSNPEGRTVTIGQQLKYEDKGKGTASITAEEAGGEEETIIDAKAEGVKVASLNELDGIKVAGTAVTKPTETQTVTKDSDTKWVVLGCKDTDNNGTNETLLLTTETPTEDTITLYGAAAYNACEEGENNIIDRMCRDLYGDEARGMTIEDVNDCLTYTPAGGMYYDASGKVKQFSNFTTKLNSLGDQWDVIKGNTYTKTEDEVETSYLFTPKHPKGLSTAEGVKTAEGKSIIEELGEYEINGYYYYLSNDGTYLVNDANSSDTSNTITEVEKNLIFGSSSNYRYWLASRGVYANTYCADFGPGAVYFGGAFSYRDYFFSDGDSGDGSLTLRAVVSLTSDIPAVVTPSESEPS